MSLPLNLNNVNKLMFATSAIGNFTMSVSITRIVDTSASQFSGTTLTMSEIQMPAGHMRVYIADFTPVQAGEYIISYFGINELGEVLQHVQRGSVGSGAGGGGVSTGGGAIGVSL